MLDEWGGAEFGAEFRSRGWVDLVEVIGGGQGVTWGRVESTENRF